MCESCLPTISSPTTQETPRKAVLFRPSIAAPVERWLARVWSGCTTHFRERKDSCTLQIPLHPPPRISKMQGATSAITAAWDVVCCTPSHPALVERETCGCLTKGALNHSLHNLPHDEVDYLGQKSDGVRHHRFEQVKDLAHPVHFWPREPR